MPQELMPKLFLLFLHLKAAVGRALINTDNMAGTFPVSRLSLLINISQLLDVGAVLGNWVSAWDSAHTFSLVPPLMTTWQGFNVGAQTELQGQSDGYREAQRIGKDQAFMHSSKLFN